MESGSGFHQIYKVNDKRYCYKKFFYVSFLINFYLYEPTQKFK